MKRGNTHRTAYTLSTANIPAHTFKNHSMKMLSRALALSHRIAAQAPCVCVWRERERAENSHWYRFMAHDVCWYLTLSCSLSLSSFISASPGLSIVQFIVRMVHRCGVRHACTCDATVYMGMLFLFLSFGLVSISVSYWKRNGAIQSEKFSVGCVSVCICSSV